MIYSAGDVDDSRPTVSVVIPTHNSMQWLDALIKTVNDQQNISTEIIIVDNESTDGTVEKIQAEYSSQVQLRFSFSIRVSRLIGVHAARGQYVAFLDHDDLWEPNKLEMQIAEFQRNPQLVALGTQHRRFFRDPEESEMVCWPAIDADTLPLIRRSRIASFHPSSMMLRRADAQHILLETLGLQPQDGAMIAEAARLGAIDKLGEPLTLVREHPDSQMRKGLLSWSEGRLRTWHVLDDPQEKQWISEHDFAKKYVGKGVRRNLKTQYLNVRSHSYRDSGKIVKSGYYRIRALGRTWSLSSSRRLKRLIQGVVDDRER